MVKMELTNQEKTHVKMQEVEVADNPMLVLPKQLQAKMQELAWSSS